MTDRRSEEALPYGGAFSHTARQPQSTCLWRSCGWIAGKEALELKRIAGAVAERGVVEDDPGFGGLRGRAELVGEVV